jgi:hypothetical protein
MPFVRLALARYQPNAQTENLTLSEILMTEFAQLLPHRTATYSISKDKKDEDRIEVRVTVAGTRPDNLTTDELPGASRTTQMYARMDESSTRLADGYLAQLDQANAWVPTGDVPLEGQRLDFDPTKGTWEGKLEIQRKLARRYSLFLEEREPTFEDTATGPKISARPVYCDRLLLDL